MNVATQCDCCKEPIEGPEFRDAACEHPVCEECKGNLYLAARLLNKHRMAGIFTGPCPDNGPEGLKKAS